MAKGLSKPMRDYFVRNALEGRRGPLDDERILVTSAEIVLRENDRALRRELRRTREQTNAARAFLHRVLDGDGSDDRRDRGHRAQRAPLSVNERVRRLDLPPVVVQSVTSHLEGAEPALIEEQLVLAERHRALLGSAMVFGPDIVREVVFKVLWGDATSAKARLEQVMQERQRAVERERQLALRREQLCSLKRRIDRLDPFLTGPARELMTQAEACIVENPREFRRVAHAIERELKLRNV